MSTATHLTRAEAAAILRCSTNTIDRRIKNGSLSTTRQGRAVLVDAAGVDAILTDRAERADALAARVHRATGAS